MTYIERTTNRSSPLFYLPECPACHISYASTHTMNDWDEWACWACWESLDLHWDIEETLWYDSDADLSQLAGRPAFDYAKTEVQPNSLGWRHCVCHDKLICPNLRTEGASLPVYGSDIKDYIDRSAFDIWTDIYAIDIDDQEDCRTCERFMSYECIPLRNWIRFNIETGGKPDEKINPCSWYNPDWQWINANHYDVERLMQTITNKTRELL